MAQENQETSINTGSGFRFTLLLPVLIFAAIATVFLFSLNSGDPSKLPSALIGKPVPEFKLQPIQGLTENGKSVPGIDSADLSNNGVTIVNIWASWCGPCVVEHPFLGELKKRSGVRLIGINHKDAPANAKKFLKRLGNPFDAVGSDRSGRASIEWGVYGVPETFVVDNKGQIIYKHVGPISRQAMESAILPAIERAKKR
ncbi:MAG: DsbE family thiol:disulfide interchange protein [Desulfobulbia bacterium]